MNKTKIPNDSIKAIELSILNDIDRFCRDHKLQYWLAYGTLLGAIRHQGFIPWDDDIDIFMFRDDYEQFLNTYNTQTSQYKVLSSHDSTYYYEFAKVVDTETSVREEQVESIQKMGVWVDIFPIDYVGKHKTTQRFLVKLLHNIRALSVYTSFQKQHSFLFKPLWKLSRLFSYKRCLTLIDKISKWQLTRTTKCGYIASAGGRYLFETRWFDHSVDVPFENNSYPAPKRYQELLLQMYGEDYMQLPPENKRIHHEFDAYWTKK